MVLQLVAKGKVAIEMEQNPEQNGRKLVYWPHRQSAWAEKASHILNLVALDDEVDEDACEQVLARLIEADTYELCSIPFFARDYALGDHVHAPAGQIEKVVKRSGRYVYRIFFSENQVHEPIIEELRTLGGCLFESLGNGLYAIDVATQDLAILLVERMSELENSGVFEWESGHDVDPSEQPANP